MKTWLQIASRNLYYTLFCCLSLFSFHFSPTFASETNEKKKIQKRFWMQCKSLELGKSESLGCHEFHLNCIFFRMQLQTSLSQNGQIINELVFESFPSENTEINYNISSIFRKIIRVGCLDNVSPEYGNDRKIREIS